jgi:hypothetical protein
VPIVEGAAEGCGAFFLCDQGFANPALDAFKLGCGMLSLPGHKLASAHASGTQGLQCRNI